MSLYYKHCPFHCTDIEVKSLTLLHFGTLNRDPTNDVDAHLLL